MCQRSGRNKKVETGVSHWGGVLLKTPTTRLTDTRTKRRDHHYNIIIMLATETLLMNSYLFTSLTHSASTWNA